MLKFIVTAALAFTAVSKPVSTSDSSTSQQTPQMSMEQGTQPIAQYVQYGTTCSAPTPYGFVPMCPMVAPMPLGSACWCTNTLRGGVVTW